MKDEGGEMKDEDRVVPAALRFLFGLLTSIRLHPSSFRLHLSSLARILD
jgi:hypothetical protein